MTARDLQLARGRVRNVLADAVITGVKSGEKALDEFRRAAHDGTPYHLAILDESYGPAGKLTGTEVSAAIRQEAQSVPSGPPIIIVGCTGFTSGDDDGTHERHARECGQDLVVGKPIPNNFGEMLLDLLAASSAHAVASTSH